ncbi:hypothetical protein BDV93DRAFT_541195 [Ceratobasidium sp. AG-I]|nr:hypothetical protein BDV93DRAFT_541195 [Ceratobasidium sp. AG-I]
MLDQAWQVGQSKESAAYDIEAHPGNHIVSTRSYSPTPRLPTPVWNGSLPPSGGNAVKSIRITRDMHSVTVKGFRTLGLASTFIAGVESQFFGVVSGFDASESALLQASNGLLLVGIVLSASGAITSFLASRWFEMLTADEVVWLEHRWAHARGETKDPVPQYLRHNYGFRNWLSAKALAIPFYMILFGALSFVTGLVVYTWDQQVRPVAIACTMVTSLCCLVVLGMYLKHEAKGVLSHMDFTRARI